MTSSTAIPRKTKPKDRHPHNALAAAFVRSAPVGRHADGNGLYLYVQRTGTRSWIQRLVIRDRKRTLGLSSVHLVSLAAAREQALANRKLDRAGGDPLADRRRLQSMPAFAEAASPSSSRSGAAGAAPGRRPPVSRASNATSCRPSAAGPSPRSAAPTCWRFSRRSGTSSETTKGEI